MKMSPESSEDKNENDRANMKLQTQREVFLVSDRKMLNIDRSFENRRK